MTQQQEDRIASLEAAVAALFAAHKELRADHDALVDRTRSGVHPASPIMQRERAEQRASEAGVVAEALRRREHERLAQTDYALDLMVRIEQIPHVHNAPGLALDHLETARPYGYSVHDWQRDKKQPDTGCCQVCCPSPVHQHGLTPSWTITGKKAAQTWAGIKAHYGKELGR